MGTKVIQKKQIQYIKRGFNKIRYWGKDIPRAQKDKVCNPNRTPDKHVWYGGTNCPN